MSNQSPGVFVTATGTDVGKTFVSAALARGARRRGLTVGVLKPFSTGEPSDLKALAQAAGVDDWASVGLWRGRRPLTPAVMLGLGEPGRRRVKGVLRASRRAMERLRKNNEVVIIEGVGGVKAPLGGPYTTVDLITTLRQPVWLVALAGLGTLNHTLLSLEALQRRGCVVRRMILNRSTGKDLSEKYNGPLLQKLTGLPVTVLSEMKSSADLRGLEDRLWADFRRDFP